MQSEKQSILPDSWDHIKRKNQENLEEKYFICGSCNLPAQKPGYIYPGNILARYKEQEYDKDGILIRNHKDRLTDTNGNAILCRRCYTKNQRKGVDEND